MKNTAVIYKSSYGSTKQYAEWIAQELGADLFEHDEINIKDLEQYNLVVYGSGLYAGGIGGVELVIKNNVKKLVIFTVGLANPINTDYESILTKNIPDSLREKVKIFHLRGNIDYEKLSFVHRIMMAMMKKMTLKKNDEFTEDDKLFLETYGGKIDFIDRNTIMPLIKYVKNLN